MGTAGRCYRGWERSALPLAALTALLLTDLCKVSRIKNLGTYERGGYCWSQPSGQWKSQRREPAQLLLFSRASSPWHRCFALTSLLFDSLTAFRDCQSRAHFIPKRTLPEQRLDALLKHKECPRHFFCLVLEGSEMEPLQALGTWPDDSPRTRPTCSGDRRSGP